MREIKNSFIFKTMFKYLLPSIVSCCSSALSNIASVSLTFEFNPLALFTVSHPVKALT